MGTFFSTSFSTGTRNMSHRHVILTTISRYPGMEPEELPAREPGEPLEDLFEISGNLEFTLQNGDILEARFGDDAQYGACIRVDMMRRRLYPDGSVVHYGHGETDEEWMDTIDAQGFREAFMGINWSVRPVLQNELTLVKK